ncbi:hypothetical protein D3C78_1340880 [compost metagenome]
MAFALFSPDFNPVIACDLILSKDSCGNAGFKVASAINSNALSKYFVNAEAEAPLAEALTFAPIKSTSSSNLAFDRVVVPSFIIALIKPEVPALLPSSLGTRSSIKLAETVGNLWSSTTKTFMPLGSVKVCG